LTLEVEAAIAYGHQAGKYGMDCESLINLAVIANSRFRIGLKYNSSPAYYD